MTSESMLTALAIILSVVSVALSGWFSIRTARLSHNLADERELRMEERSALKAAERVYEPLTQAAAELQSRLYNIVETGWVELMRRYASHGDYAVTSTAFLFAHYLGWVEVRRQAVLDSSGEGSRDLDVQRLLDGVLKSLRRSEKSQAFLFFTSEQRAIGELMSEWITISDSGQRIPQVMGYAAFSERYTADPAFRQWFASVELGMTVDSIDEKYRLVEIHRALVALIVHLDPKSKYTVGHEVKEITLD